MTYHMEEFLRDLCASDTAPSDRILDYLSKTDTERLSQIMARLEHVRSLDLTKLVTVKKKRKVVDGQKAALIGKLLERAIRELVSGCKCLEMGANFRSNTSEIDFLVTTNSLSQVVPMLKKVDTHLIGEAKCYSSGMKSEWVNELVGIMSAHSANHSILFLATPSKKLRADHRHTIHLHSVQGKVVVPFGLAQLAEVIKGRNFLRVLSEQYVHTVAGSANLAI